MDSEDEERSDFRAVPTSDNGEAYRDRGMLGGYSPEDDPFRNPSDVRFETGFGVEMADVERGWCDPLITDDPAYSLANYKERLSQPRESDVTPGNLEAVSSDFEFRNHNRRTRGFLTRPRIPTERG